MDTSSEQEKGLNQKPEPTQIVDRFLSNKKQKFSIAALACTSLFFALIAGFFKYEAIDAERLYIEKIEALTQQKNQYEASAQVANAEIQRRDVAVAKELERLTVSDGYPVRAERPVKPLDYKFENKNVAWLNTLPFGASKESIKNAIPSLACTADGKGCTSGINKNLNQQCLLGIDRACEAIVLFFSNENKLESIFVTYKIVEIQSDPLIFFLGYLDKELGQPSRTFTSDAGIKTLHDAWKVGKHGIIFNSHTREQDNTPMFLSLKITQNPNF